MHVLLTGASGFIGRHICARLLAAGHAVTACVRAPETVRRRFPGIAAVSVDLNRMAAISDWSPLLTGIDAVVNCAGILQTGRGQSATAIHTTAPVALFDACAARGIRRAVQISAVSADAAAGTEYALSKKAADDHLRALDLDWTVLRPSLVYGSGSFGGTSVIRGLAGLPWITPLIGSGEQRLTALALYGLAGACWIVVVAIQIRVAKLAAHCAAAGTALPRAYHRAMRLWFLLGWPAFAALLVVFWLMVAKPDLW